LSVDEAITQLLTNSGAAERVLAAESLGQVDSDYAAVIDGLVRGLADPNSTVRQTSVDALLNIWRTLNAPLVLCSPLDREQTDADLVPPNHEAPDADLLFELVIPALKRILPDEDKYVRLAAAEALRNLNSADGEVLSVLVESARDSDEHLRRRAAYAFWQGAADLKLVLNLGAPFLGGARAPLQQVDSEPVIAVLIELVQDPSRAVREYALNAIRSIGPAASAAAPVLTQALHDQDDIVRFKAAGALASVGVTSSLALASLVAGLTDPDRLKRKAAASGLRTLGAEAKPATPDLIKALQDEDPHVRARCSRALGNIGPEVGEAGIHALRALESDQEHIVRAAAAQALAAIGKESVAAAIHRSAGFAGRDSYPLTGFKTDDIPGLISMLRAPDPNMRAFAATALRLTPGDTHSAIPELIILLKDEDEDVRRRAAETLNAIRDVAGGNQ
jgi:HEAT repeat protein